jgi:hypothetical protein
LLIEVVTNTALTVVVVYQICMMAFFYINEREEEALVCTFVFIMSIFYTVVSYEKVNDITAHDRSSEGAAAAETPQEMASTLNKWR